MGSGMGFPAALLRLRPSVRLVYVVPVGFQSQLLLLVD
jgi:hypothetical protein